MDQPPPAPFLPTHIAAAAAHTLSTLLSNSSHFAGVCATANCPQSPETLGNSLPEDAKFNIS